ncbi:MAG: hypothetical protein DRH37_11320, partial [Deltaproteobacteria bacterium]
MAACTVEQKIDMVMEQIYSAVGPDLSATYKKNVSKLVDKKALAAEFENAPVEVTSTNEAIVRRAEGLAGKLAAIEPKLATPITGDGNKDSALLDRLATVDTSRVVAPKTKAEKAAGEKDPAGSEWVMRNGNPNFGNPFYTVAPNNKKPGDMKVADDGSATEAYWNWLMNDVVPAGADKAALDTRRKVILDNLDKIRNAKALLYAGTAKDKDVSHVNALIDISENYGKETKPPKGDGSTNFNPTNVSEGKRTAYSKEVISKLGEIKNISSKEVPVDSVNGTKDKKEGTATVYKVEFEDGGVISDIYFEAGSMSYDGDNAKLLSNAGISDIKTLVGLGKLIEDRGVTKGTEKLTIKEVEELSKARPAVPQYHYAREDRKGQSDEVKGAMGAAEKGQPTYSSHLEKEYTGISKAEFAEWTDLNMKVSSSEYRTKANINRMFEIEDKYFASTAKFDKDIRGGSSDTVNVWDGSGENAGLSNFAKRPFTVDGMEFHSVEQAFQLAKTLYGDGDKSMDSRLAMSDVLEKLLGETVGKKLKALGGKIPNLDTTKWNKERSEVMKTMLTESFKQNPDALAELVATGDAKITHTQESGYWKEEFPKLLMEVRSELGGKESTTTTEESPVGSKESEVREWILGSSAKNHVAKEAAKASIATQAIAEGKAGSTADNIGRIYGDKANTGSYTADDIIYISTNGNRGGRVKPVVDGELQGEYANI